MVKFFIRTAALLALFLCVFIPNVYAADLVSQVKEIRYQMTAIEHTDVDKEEAYKDLTDKADMLIKEYPDKAESYTWKGISLSAYAKHSHSLSSAKQAKEYLEKAISIDKTASDAAALNALAIMYYKVPGWPISFGSNTEAEKYFNQALSVSSNIDTNYRYGEFLVVEKKNYEEGSKYLEKALSLKNREGRLEDALKKEEIKGLLNKIEKKQKYASYSNN